MLSIDEKALAERYFNVRISKSIAYRKYGKNTFKENILKAHIIPLENETLPYNFNGHYEFFGNAKDGDIVEAKIQRQLFYHGRDLWMNTWIDNDGSERPTRFIFVEKGTSTPFL